MLPDIYDLAYTIVSSEMSNGVQAGRVGTFTDERLAGRHRQSSEATSRRSTS
jgi:hypothetical protein